LFVGRWLGLWARGILRDLPPLAAKHSLDGIVMDQVSIGTEAACAAAGLPLAVACAALPLHFESRVPPITAFAKYRPGLPFQIRNLAWQMAAHFTGLPVVREILPYRLRHGLPRMKFDHMNQMPPSLVQVAQQPACLDFPRRGLPDHFHYTGPWKEKGPTPDTSFPWHRLDGRPLIYASMGTLQNRLDWIFRVIAEACAGLETQLVMTLGSKDASVPAHLTGDPVVVDYAPQEHLLERASLVITHGGLNTVLESLSQGLPLVVLPIANDQPGIAARIEHLRLGQAITLNKLTGPVLRQAVLSVLGSRELRENAGRCAEQIRRGGNQAQAAELIEQALTRRSRIRAVQRQS